MSAEPTQNELAEALIGLRATLTPIGEAVDGYRADLERRGWSPTAAEHMALEFHRYLMVQLTQATGK